MSADRNWLVQQLREWPKRVHPDRTTNSTYLMDEAADLIERQAAEIARKDAALEWYGEQARLSRLIHSEGDAGRRALSEDGGKLARKALEDTNG